MTLLPMVQAVTVGDSDFGFFSLYTIFPNSITNKKIRPAEGEPGDATCRNISRLADSQYPPFNCSGVKCQKYLSAQLPRAAASGVPQPVG